MAFSSRTISREMEVQIRKAPPCLNPFLMGSHVAPPRYFCSGLSMSAPVFKSGMSNGHGALDLCGGRKRDRKVIYMEYMFSKIMTTSDVGKLNRLLIPKQCAEECFPKISEANNGGDDNFLYFEEFSTGFIWRFRFCLLNSCRTYVLTSGWHVFIKEKNLKKGDIVSFYRDACKTTSTNHMFIHIKPQTSPMSLPYHDRVHESLGLGKNEGIVPASKPLSFGSEKLMPPTIMMPQQPTIPRSTSLKIGRAEKRLRLFGVNIDITSYGCGDESCSGFTKIVV